MNNYRTKTYIAGDWDHDLDAVNQLHKWNNSNYWHMSFTDVHDSMSARDSSLNCNIKSSLKKRMDISKKFILIVGEQTNSVTAGGCQWCNSYNSHTYNCAKGYSIDYRSYIKYECDKAIEADIKIIVLYKSTKVDKNKCPQSLRSIGIHSAMLYKDNDVYHWDYPTVKKAFYE